MEALQESNAPPTNAAASFFAQANAPQQEDSQPLPAISKHNAWPAVEWLPIQLDVSVPVVRFCVRDLLGLWAGQVIPTAWSSGEDLPLAIEDVQLAWVEMEVVDHSMAIRITRLM